MWPVRQALTLYYSGNKKKKMQDARTYHYVYITLFICLPLHLSLVPFTLASLLSPNETMNMAHNQASGPEMYCQKGAHDPIFRSGSVISVS